MHFFSARHCVSCSERRLWPLVTSSPWHNRNGWLGVKHLLISYTNYYKVQLSDCVWVHHKSTPWSNSITSTCSRNAPFLQPRQRWRSWPPSVNWKIKWYLNALQNARNALHPISQIQVSPVLSVAWAVPAHSRSQNGSQSQFHWDSVVIF